MDKTIVLGSLSLRASRVTKISTTDNDVLGAVSLRVSRVTKISTTDNDVMGAVSLPVAGFQHSGGEWEDPKDMSYVTIHI